MILSQLLLGIIAATAFFSPPSANLTKYYGPSLSVVKGEALRSNLHMVLAKGHRATKGFDEIVDSCSDREVSEQCVMHRAIGYQAARETIFGDFYLEMRGKEFGVQEVYCSRIFLASEFRGAKPGPKKIPNHDILNAEHTWPQSHFTSAFPKDVQKSDLHHLFPTDSQMNSKRSSHPFGDVGRDDEILKCKESRIGSSTQGDAIVFEPPSEHKGNVARAMFYFAVRYRMQIPVSEERYLREWHRRDPVDSKELDRNEKIFSLQGNRNPFVDFPELVDKISDF